MGTHREYFGNSQATANTVTPDGWLKTGDIGIVDEEGYIYVVDRIKELIKYKGFQGGVDTYLTSSSEF